MGILINTRARCDAVITGRYALRITLARPPSVGWTSTLKLLVSVPSEDVVDNFLVRLPAPPQIAL